MAQERDIVRDALQESGFVLDTGNPAPIENPPPIQTPEPTPEAEPTPTPEYIPTPEATPEPVTFDENKFLTEKFGDKFKSFEEITSKLGELDQINTRYTQAEQKAKDLESKLSENEFANDYVKGLNKFVKDGGDMDVYNKVAGIDVTKISEKDALVLKYQFQHGMSKEDAEFKVARRYKIGEEFNAEDPDVRESRIDLQIEGREAKDFLSKYKAEQLVPPGAKTEADQKQLVQSRIASWQPHTNTLLTSLNKVEVPFDEKKGDTISFNIPKETIDHLSGHMQVVLENMDVAPDEQGRQWLKDVLLREIYYLHQKDIARLVAGEVNKRWAKTNHNPSALREETVPVNTTVMDRDEEIASFIRKANGYKS